MVDGSLWVESAIWAERTLDLGPTREPSTLWVVKAGSSTSCETYGIYFDTYQSLLDQQVAGEIDETAFQSLLVEAGATLFEPGWQAVLEGEGSLEVGRSYSASDLLGQSPFATRIYDLLSVEGASYEYGEYFVRHTTDEMGTPTPFSGEVTTSSTELTGSITVELQSVSYGSGPMDYLDPVGTAVLDISALRCVFD